MSKSITIKEGGLSRQFGPESGLTTKTQDGGTCLWIPKSEIPLTTKSITKNGVYKASDDNAYGYSQVTVNVSDSDFIAGKDQDGNDVVVKKGGDGSLVQSKQPSKIAVTKAPNNINYHTGENLSFDGIEVTAYYEDDSVYGVIPFNELVFPVTQAPRTQQQANRETTSDLTTNWAQPIKTYSVVYNHANNNKTGSEAYEEFNTFTPLNGAVIVVRKNSPKTCAIWFVSKQPGTIGKLFTRVRRGWVDDGEWKEITGYYTTSDERSYTHDGKTVYYTYSEYQNSAFVDYDPEVSDVGSGADGPTLWTAVYGDETLVDGYQVPVQWYRPWDYKLLETGYTINVIAFNRDAIWNAVFGSSNQG